MLPCVAWLTVGAIVAGLSGQPAQPMQPARPGQPVQPGQLVQHEPHERPAYHDRRFEEDWSVLRDRDALSPRDPFDRLKFIPLSKSGGSWLTLGGQIRLREENYREFQLGASTPSQSDSYLLSRIRVRCRLALRQSCACLRRSEERARHASHADRRRHRDLRRHARSAERFRGTVGAGGQGERRLSRRPPGTAVRRAARGRTKRLPRTCAARFRGSPRTSIWVIGP